MSIHARNSSEFLLVFFLARFGFSLLGVISFVS